MQFSIKLAIFYNDFEIFFSSSARTKTDNINTWLTRFESLVDSFNFSEMQKFIFVERTLKGLALLFIQSESNLTSYSASYSWQFSSNTEIHHLLAARYCTQAKIS